MRTKTLLAAAAATLTLGLAASQAQTVYSQNIVGYVNQVFPANGAYSLIVTPLQATNGNAGADLVLPAVQANDSILVFNGAGYDTYTYLGSGTWLGPAGPGAAPTLNAGQAFFYENNSTTPETNTFVGTVVLTNSASLPAGYSLTGSIAPVAGGVDSTNISLPAQANDSVLLFNGNGYDTYTYLGSGTWLGPAGPGTAPSVNVGQGFFYQNNSGSPEQWNQNVVVQ